VAHRLVQGRVRTRVLTGGFLATNSKGQTFVVVEMLESPAAWLYPSASLGLQAIASSAFATLSPQRYKPSPVVGGSSQRGRADAGQRVIADRTSGTLSADVR